MRRRRQSRHGHGSSSTRRQRRTAAARRCLLPALAAASTCAALIAASYLAGWGVDRLAPLLRASPLLASPQQSSPGSLPLQQLPPPPKRRSGRREGIRSGLLPSSVASSSSSGRTDGAGHGHGGGIGTGGLGPPPFVAYVNDGCNPSWVERMGHTGECVQRSALLAALSDLGVRYVEYVPPEEDLLPGGSNNATAAAAKALSEELCRD